MIKNTDLCNACGKPWVKTEKNKKVVWSSLCRDCPARHTPHVSIADTSKKHKVPYDATLRRLTKDDLVEGPGGVLFAKTLKLPGAGE